MAADGRPWNFSAPPADSSPAVTSVEIPKPVFQKDLLIFLIDRRTSRNIHHHEKSFLPAAFSGDIHFPCPPHTVRSFLDLHARTREQSFWICMRVLPCFTKAKKFHMSLVT